MFGDFMGKMQEAQQQMEKAKKQLDTTYVQAQAEGGLVKVVATANKKITELSIDPSVVDPQDIETLEDLVIVAINKALEKAEAVHQAEMQALSSKYLGALGGMF